MSKKKQTTANDFPRWDAFSVRITGFTEDQYEACKNAVGRANGGALDWYEDDLEGLTSYVIIAEWATAEEFANSILAVAPKATVVILEWQPVRKTIKASV